MWQLWLILAGVFFVLEIATVGFLIFWFGIGALIAMVVSFFTKNIIIQTVVFIISSTLLLFLTRPFVNKFVHKKDDDVQTNVYSLINKEGIVTKGIDPVQSVGQVKVDGEIWSATCNGDSTIPKGTKIKVLQIDGVKLLVEPIQ